MKTEFYKMEYESWDEGTDNLTLEQEGAYLRICHQMYRRRGPIPNQANTLARIWRCHPNKAAALIKQLLAAGKIDLTPEGHLTNTKVTQVLHDRGIQATQAVENGRKGGLQRADNAAKQLNLLGSDQAVASSHAKPDQAIIEDKSIEDNSCALAGATSRLEELFERFWELYPKRDGANPKKPALEKFAQAVNGSPTRKPVEPETIMTGLRGFIASLNSKNKIGTEFVPMAKAWLHQAGWEQYAAIAAFKPISSTKYFAVSGSEQKRQWDEYAVRKFGKPYPEMESRQDGKLCRGWYVDAEWPPADQKKPPGQAQAA